MVGNKQLSNIGLQNSQAKRCAFDGDYWRDLCLENRPKRDGGARMWTKTMSARYCLSQCRSNLKYIVVLAVIQIPVTLNDVRFHFVYCNYFPITPQ